MLDNGLPRPARLDNYVQLRIVASLVTAPGDEKVARDEWGSGLLFTQSWRTIDPQTLLAGTSDTNPLGVAHILNYRIANGWYVGNGDMVARWDWDGSAVKNSYRFNITYTMPVGF